MDLQTILQLILATFLALLILAGFGSLEKNLSEKDNNPAEK